MLTRDHQFISQSGATFFLTSSIMGWKCVFIKPIRLDILIKCLIFYQDNGQVKIVGNCLMPMSYPLAISYKRQEDGCDPGASHI